jgi:hypothetical protein
MQNFYVYRYVDEQTKEIVYIGKTSQLFVTNRLDQHKTDNVGVWASKTPHYIEFVELPREEDMTYLESYLIRKIKPRLNIVLFTHVAPPFELALDENKWMNLDKYLADKEKAKTIQADIFASQVATIAESNMLFETTIRDIISEMTMNDKNFIKKICFMNKLTLSRINISIEGIAKAYPELSIEDACKRIVGFTRNSRIAGTVSDIRKVGFFDEYEIRDEYIILHLNTYIKKILAVL